MWRKMLKLREIAKTFYILEIGSGRHISFWYYCWSEKGVIFDLAGERGFIALGIRKEATLEEAVLNLRRRRQHRSEVLREIEEALESVRSKIQSEKMDVSIWRRRSGYREIFSTNETWMLLRGTSVQCLWTRGTWFSMATPKHAFMTWLAMRGRLSTMGRVSRWSQGTDTTYVLCKTDVETLNHLFFECSYATQLWEHLVKGILGNAFTNGWSEMVRIISSGGYDKKSIFCIRYAF